MCATKTRVESFIEELKKEANFGCGAYEQALSDVADRLAEKVSDFSCESCGVQMDQHRLVCGDCYSDQVEAGAIIEETASLEMDLAIIGVSVGRSLAYLEAHSITKVHPAGPMVMARMLRTMQENDGGKWSLDELTERLDAFFLTGVINA